MRLNNLRKNVLFFVISFVMFSQYADAKDLEIVLHKTFLQKIIDKAFPIKISENNSANSDSKNIFAYKLEISDPILNIHPKYAQLNATTNFSSILGNKVFPTACKLVPVYNSKSKDIEMKVIEGKIDLNMNSEGFPEALGSVDLAQYLSDIKIPVRINDIQVKDKVIKTECKNVSFMLLKDRIIVDADLQVN